MKTDPLTERARKRDPGAWAEIYERFSAQIYGFFLNQIGDVHLAEDLTGGVFLEALQAAHRFEGKTADLRSWLFRIGRNNLIDHFRRAGGTQVSPLDEVDNSDLSRTSPQEDPVEAAMDSIDRDRILAAMRDLSPEQREVLFLRMTGDLTSAQIAEILGKSVGAIKALQHRAVGALARALGGKGVSEGAL